MMPTHDSFAGAIDGLGMVVGAIFDPVSIFLAIALVALTRKTAWHFAGIAAIAAIAGTLDLVLSRPRAHPALLYASALAAAFLQVAILLLARDLWRRLHRLVMGWFKG
jgi:hypothetical protein